MNKHQVPIEKEAEELLELSYGRVGLGLGPKGRYA